MFLYVKIGVVYIVKIIVEVNGNILKVYCLCFVGVDGCCNYLVVILFVIEDK